MGKKPSRGKGTKNTLVLYFSTRRARTWGRISTRGDRGSNRARKRTYCAGERGTKEDKAFLFVCFLPFEGRMNCSLSGNMASSRGLPAMPRRSVTSRRRVEGGQRTSTLTRVADIFVEESADLTTFQNILLFMGGAGGIALGVA